jgi:hypothetical protein
MRPRTLTLSAAAVLSGAGLVTLGNGCTGSGEDLFHQGGGTATHTSGGGGSSSGGSAAHGGTTPQGGGGSAAHGGTSPQGGGGYGAQGGTGPQGGGGAGAQGGQGGAGPCDSSCGGVEQCDGIHAGIDDDCDGTVDESCACIPGTVQACFKGDPHYRNTPGCFAGTQHCSAQGQWGSCVGGVHATDHCYLAQPGCHAITSYPLVGLGLKPGTGNFSSDAVSESWTVDCPPGTTGCPGVTAPDFFQPVQSGEYQVHYQKTTANGAASCTYPLLVGFTGLRVELDWEHGVTGPSDTGVDLDLHVHKPQDATAWGASHGTLVDCAWDNCVFHSFVPMSANAPNWFSGVAPPDPMGWYRDSVLERNTCYFAPHGIGAQWQGNGQGCYNPRLELDNITCNPTVTNPNDQAFCVPENTNVDYPPENQWFRIGVHYYSAHGMAYDVHPRVLVFCGGELRAELGPQGYANPVTFTPAGGADPANSTFWLVADVRFVPDPCNANRCQVRPLYADEVLRSALVGTVPTAQASIGPPYLP